ncbi:MAG TPA: hypothetical protein VFV66_36595, partial [Nonomuraea sp.]|nr:hypothetical protein [Nonomuraea sp.]
DREQPPAAEPQRPGQRQRPAQPQRQAAERRKAKPQPVAAAADPDAATVQAPLPQRQPAAAANLADLVEPAKRATPAQPDMAEQRTVTFAAPTPDVMSILGAGAQPVPAARPEPTPTTRPQPAVSSNAFPGGSYPATPAASAAQANSGAFPVSPPLGTGSSFPAAGPTSSGSFPAAQPAPIHGAPTSDPFPAYTNAADPLETTRTGPRTPATPSASGSWPAVGTADILDDPTPAPSPSPAPSSYASGSSWPAFEQPARSSYPASYEVRTGWAVADDSEPLPNTTSATGTPTTPSRAVSAYDDVLSASTPQSSFPAYETGDITTAPGVAWPEPPAANGSQANLPAAGYGGTDMFGNTTPPQPSNGRRRPSDKDHPHDYYR